MNEVKNGLYNFIGICSLFYINLFKLWTYIYLNESSAFFI